MQTTGSWTKQDIVELLEKSNKAIERGLIVLYNRQTATEQATQQTNEHNGIGFSSNDAEILTSMAQWYLSHGWLSEKQIALVRKRIKKYWRQLLEVANASAVPPPQKPAPQPQSQPQSTAIGDWG